MFHPPINQMAKKMSKTAYKFNVRINIITKPQKDATFSANNTILTSWQ